MRIKSQAKPIWLNHLHIFFTNTHCNQSSFGASNRDIDKTKKWVADLTRPKFLGIHQGISREVFLESDHGHSPPAGMKIWHISKTDIMDKVHPEE